MNAEKIGLLIYELRTRKGFTQKELAEKCNVSDKAVSKWERGDGCPDVTVFPRLAEVFGIEVETIMNGEIPFSHDVSGKTIKEYDFRQPDRYPRYMQRELLMLGENICQILNKEFTLILNERCEFCCEKVDQMTNKEFLNSIPQKCFFYDFDFANGGFTVEIDLPIAKSLLKQNFSKYDVISDFDLDVFKNYFLKEIFNLISQNVKKQTKEKFLFENQFPFEKIISAPNSNNNRQEEHRMMLLLSLKGKTCGNEGLINFQFSDVLIDHLFMNGYFGTNNESYNGKIKFKNLTNLKSRQMPDNVFIEFGRFRPENVNLEQGMILILDKKENEGLNVVFENRVIHTGKTLSIDEQFGIEIAETTQLNEIIYDETDYISIQLGSTSLTKQEIIALHKGSYILLKQRAGEMTQIIRSGKFIAVGEICIVEDTFAIRVVEVCA